MRRLLALWALVVAPAWSQTEVFGLDPVTEGVIVGSGVGVGTVYAESLLWAWGLKELAKNAFHRRRPWSDEADSFPSGHTTLAFTGAAFATVAFERAYPGSPWTLPLGVASYGLAAGAAALRVTSGNHYLSDVVAGALVGTLAGVIVPGLHRGGEPSLAPLPQGLALSWSF